MNSLFEEGKTAHSSSSWENLHAGGKMGTRTLAARMLSINDLQICELKKLEEQTKYRGQQVNWQKKKKNPPNVKLCEICTLII